MRKSTMWRHNVRIEEVDNGWELTWATGDSEFHPTAAGAQKAVMNFGYAMANADVSTVGVIEWISHSRVGATVVRALTAK